MHCHGVSQWGYGLLNSVYIIVNVILAGLIVSRLIYRRKHFRNILGSEHRYPYINVMTMWVESSVLVVILIGTYTALTFVQRRRPDADWALIPFQLLPHICVGGLEHHDIWFASNIFWITRLSPSPHRLSCCHGSCYNPNFAAIRTREGLD